MTVIETTDYLQEVFLNLPIEEWEEEVRALDVPDVYLGVCAFLSTGLALLLEEDQLLQLVPGILGLLG